MTIKTIIAAIALEGGDEPVVRRAIQLTAEHEARLILVHAIESLSASDPDLPTPATVEAIMACSRQRSRQACPTGMSSR